jgi:hypothetical protein
MLFREIIAVYFENYTNPLNTRVSEIFITVLWNFNPYVVGVAFRENLSVRKTFCF